MSHKIYILEQKIDRSGPVEKVVEEAYYGPFHQNEEYTRVNDAYADQLEAAGAEVFSIAMEDSEASKYHINSREFWMSQLETLQFIERVNGKNDYGDCETCGKPCTKNGCEAVSGHSIVMA